MSFTRTFTYAAFTLMIGLASLQAQAQCAAKQRAFIDISQYRNNDIQGPLNVGDVEGSHMIAISETGEILAFGNANPAWVGFKNTIISGDKIYFVHPHEGTVQQSYYLLIRDGCEIRDLPVVLS